MPFIGKQSTANSKIKKSRFTATASQTDFGVTTGAGDELQVFLNGVLLKETDDYTYTTSTVTLGTEASADDIVEVHVYQSFTIADTVDIAGDTMTGELEVPTVKLSSNVIKASDGGSTITLDTSDNVTIAGNLKTDTIAEKTSATGVTIDGVLLKDSSISSGSIGASVTMSANQSCVKTALNASNDPPIYACRAWGHISSGGVASKSGNVSGVSLTDTSKYAITFDTNMPTANYAIVLGHLTTNNSSARISNVFIEYGTTPSTSGFTVRTMHGPSSGSNASNQAMEFYFAVFE